MFGIIVIISVLVWGYFWILLSQTPYCFRMRIYDREVNLFNKIRYFRRWIKQEKICWHCKYFTFTPRYHEDGWDGECDLRPGEEVQNFGFCVDGFRYNEGKLRIDEEKYFVEGEG